MNVFSRGLLIGALTLLLLNTSCNLPAITPTPTASTIPTSEVISPTVIPTDSIQVDTPTTLIPVTGMEQVSMQCQFCVNDEPHVVLIMPQSAQFYVSDATTRINCITAQVVNDKRILLCRGTQQASFNINVCAENATCLQYPILLETCPLNAKTVVATPVVLTPINTAAPPTSESLTPTPVPTQPISSPPPVVATTTVPLPTNTQPVVVATVTAIPPQPTGTLPPPATTTTRLPQSGRTPIPSTRLPRTGLYDPEGFVRWYFESVWKERNYQELWDNYLTPAFKTRTTASSFDEYVTWWSSVDRVDVNSVNVIENNGSQAWVRVNVTFHMKDGRVISNQEYDYDLLFDPARQTWMFDYHL